MPAKDMIGQRFGRLTVVERAENKADGSETGRAMWKCLCDCGNTTIVSGRNLRNGSTKSCGCLLSERQKERKRGNRSMLVGQKYGRLTVIADTGKGVDGNSLWLCRCDCGNMVQVRSDYLKRGLKRSCGCLQKETREDGTNRRKHGMSKTRLHRIWRGMKSRCFNPNATHYEYYGGRGITVCKEWADSFEKFRDWALANGYSDVLTIDRKDNDGNYEPNNCKWVTVAEQNQNKRNVKRRQ